MSTIIANTQHRRTRWSTSGIGLRPFVAGARGWSLSGRYDC